MTENNAIENATRAAEGLLEKGTFSLLDTVKDRTYPEKDVPIFTDMKSTHLRKVLEDEANGLGNTDADKARMAILEEEIQGLEEAIRNSGLIFSLRGLSPSVIESAELTVKKELKDVKYDSEEAAEDAFNQRMSDLLMALHILKVTRVQDGAVDDHTFTADDIAGLRAAVPFEAWKTIREAMDELTFQAAYFDASVSADFLSKS